MRYLLSTIFCLWASCAWAFPPGFIGAVTQGATTGGGTSWSCTDADTFCENFSGSTDCGEDTGGATNCAYTYAVTESTYGTVAFANTNSGIGGQSGDYSVRVSDTSSASDGPSVIYDYGSSKSVLYTQLYVRITTAPNLDGRYVNFYSAVYTGASIAWRLRLTRVSSSAYKIQLEHLDNSSTTRISDSSLTNLTLGTWYGVRVYWNANQSSGGVSWAIDYDLDGTFTNQSVNTSDGTADRTIRYSIYSASTTNLPDMAAVDIDMLKADTGGYPSPTVP